MSNEADTCRTYILPKLKDAGWEDDYITEQLVLTPSRRLHTPFGALYPTVSRAESLVELDALLPSPYGDDIRVG